MSDQRILAIWNPDRSLKIVRVASINQYPTRCYGCGNHAWPLDHDARTIVVSHDGKVRLCIVCLFDADSEFVGPWMSLDDGGPDPLEAVARHFECGLSNGYIER